MSSRCRSTSQRSSSRFWASGRSASTNWVFSRVVSWALGSSTKAWPPVIPAPRLYPKPPRTTTVPPVMYSQAWSPTPSMTAVAPELRTANRSPAAPATNSEPPVAPYRQVFPASTAAPASSAGGRTTTRPPDMDLPT